MRQGSSVKWSNPRKVVAMKREPSGRPQQRSPTLFTFPNLLLKR